MGAENGCRRTGEPFVHQPAQQHQVLGCTGDLQHHAARPQRGEAACLHLPLLDGKGSELIEDQPFAQRIAQFRDDFFSDPARAGDEFGIGGDAGDEA